MVKSETPMSESSFVNPSLTEEENRRLNTLLETMTRGEAWHIIETERRAESPTTNAEISAATQPVVGEFTPIERHLTAAEKRIPPTRAILQKFDNADENRRIQHEAANQSSHKKILEVLRETDPDKIGKSSESIDSAA